MQHLSGHSARRRRQHVWTLILVGNFATFHLQKVKQFKPSYVAIFILKYNLAIMYANICAIFVLHIYH